MRYTDVSHCQKPMANGVSQIVSAAASKHSLIPYFMYFVHINKQNLKKKNPRGGKIAQMRYHCAQICAMIKSAAGDTQPNLGYVLTILNIRGLYFHGQRFCVH